MREQATETTEELSTDLGRSSEIILHFLIYIPLLLLYPIYYSFIKSKEDTDIEDEMKHSPLLKVLDTPDSLLIPFISLILFSAIFVIAVTQISGFTVGTALKTISGIFFGLLLMLYIGIEYLERELLNRTATAVIMAITFGSLFFFSRLYDVGAFTQLDIYQSQLKYGFVPATASIIGSMIGNSYIVQRQASRQREKQKGDSDSDSDDHTRTKRRKGTEISDSKGEKIIKNFADSRWVVPDELPNKSSIKKTRKIKPLRDIVRVLGIKITNYEQTIPKTHFQKEKSKHRTDYRNRKEIAPDGFKSKTYTFYKPGSKTTDPCNNCSGAGKIECGKCGTRGKVRCGGCNGSGKNKCRKCSGEGRITVDEKCPACRGSGEKSNGFTCNRCSGYGSVEKRRSCPDCRNGTVDCSNCGGRGKITCGDCGGSGYHECGRCDGCGKITKFEYVERKYSPDKEVTYRTKSVPKQLLTDANGKQITLENDDNPSTNGIYRRQDETREITVNVVTFEYLDDRWELFDVEGDIKGIDFPRDYQKQFRLVKIGLLAAIPLYIYTLSLVL